MSNANDNVYFFTSMQEAGLQLASDMNALIAAQENQRTKPGPAVAPLAIPIIGAIASVVGAVAEVASFGVKLASLVGSSSSASSESPTGVGLEVEVTNHMSIPVVFESAALGGTDSNPIGGVTKAMLALAPGESEIVLFTNGYFDLNTTLTLNIDVCFRDADDSVVVIPLKISYEWVTVTVEGKTDKRWQATFDIDGNTSNFSTYLQLHGAAFVATTAGYPSFSVYTTPVSTQSGQIDLMFYNLGPQTFPS